MTDPSHDAHVSWLLALAPEYLAFDTTRAGLEGAFRFRGASDGRADYRIQSGTATDECNVALQISVARGPQPRVSYVTVMPDLMSAGRPFCLAGTAT